MKTDFEIQKDVREELTWEPSINANDINVSVKNGVVTISGTVDSYFKKEKAEKAAKRVEGVTRVFENLDVKLPSETRKKDSEIERAVLNELKWNTSISGDKVKVKVKNGTVSLAGEVEWEFQRIAIRNTIKNLAGVKGIVNNIKIVPSITASEIKQKINLAFHRNATIDAENINVQTSGSKVILTGRVKSWMEKKEAETSAWFAPGVDKVENKLEVDKNLK
jgi:osmotically-inducible protein OsmY